MVGYLSLTSHAHEDSPAAPLRVTSRYLVADAPRSERESCVVCTPDLAHAPPLHIGALIWLGIAPTFIGYIAWNAALHRVSAASSISRHR